MTRSQPVLCLLRSRPLRAGQEYIHNVNGKFRRDSIHEAPRSGRIYYEQPSSKHFIHLSRPGNADVSSSRILTDNTSSPAPPANETIPHISSTSSSSSIGTNRIIQPSSSGQPITFKVTINPSTTPSSLEKPVDFSFLNQFLTLTTLHAPSIPPSSSAPPSISSITNTPTSQYSLAAQTQTSPQIPPIVPDLKSYPHKYHVARTASAQLPIYQTRKRGGNLLLTLIRKITGDLDALRDEFVKELNLLGEREDIVAVGGTEAKDGQNDKGERSKRGTTTAAASAVIGAKGKKPKSAKQLKYAKPVKIDEVCWIKRECGHVVIKGHHASHVIEFLKGKGF